MSSADQRTKIGELGKEVGALGEKVDSMKEKNGEVIDELKARLKKVEEADLKQKRDIENDQKKANSDRKEVKDKIDDMQDDMETVADDIAKQRAKLKEVQSELDLRLMDMDGCVMAGLKCEEAEFLLAQSAKNTTSVTGQAKNTTGHAWNTTGRDQNATGRLRNVTGHARNATVTSLLAARSYSDEDPPLYFEIEALEEQRNALQKELTEEIGSSGMQQRNLLHRIDMVEAKMRRQGAKADKYEHTDSNLAKITKRQSKSMSDYRKSKQAQLERIKNDVQAAQTKYDDLEKAMGKCGCGPQGF